MKQLPHETATAGLEASAGEHETATVGLETSAGGLAHDQKKDATPTG